MLSRRSSKILAFDRRRLISDGEIMQPKYRPDSHPSDSKGRGKSNRIGWQ
jgi:hypothetical protein